MSSQYAISFSCTSCGELNTVWDAQKFDPQDQKMMGREIKYQSQEIKECVEESYRLEMLIMDLEDRLKTTENKIEFLKQHQHISFVGYQKWLEVRNE